MGAAIGKEEIKRVYALAAGLGIVERGNKNDDLHALVYRVTGKESVSALTGTEFRDVERELLRLMRLSNRRTPLKSRRRKKEPDTPGMMTAAQQGLAWRLIYRLEELDARESSATPGERMCGAIRKILGIEAGAENPFRWVNFAAGEKLIEQLKRYVRSAERRKRKAG